MLDATKLPKITVGPLRRDGRIAPPSLYSRFIHHVFLRGALPTMIACSLYRERDRGQAFSLPWKVCVLRFSATLRPAHVVGGKLQQM